MMSSKQSLSNCTTADVSRSPNCDSKSTGDNLSQLSQPTSETSLHSEISAEKYQRLATQFAKLRSQFLVLKKSVVTEQNKNEELDDLLKSNDQDCRRLRQEVESLEFRNRQLAKRVSVLQTELDERDSPKRGSSGRPFRLGQNAARSVDGPNGATVPDGAIIDEICSELKTKTEEVERLKELVRELDSKRIEHVEHVESSLRHNSGQCTEQVDGLKREMQEVSDTLASVRAEKREAERRLGQSERQLESVRAKLDSVHQENETLTGRVRNLQELVSCRESRQPDRVCPSKCNAGIPPSCSSSQQYKSYQDVQVRQNVIRDVSSKLVEFICALSTLHSNMADKISIMLALFNKNANHLYFLDLHSSESVAGSEDTSGIGPHRSQLVKTILRKFGDYLKSSYSTSCLVYLEDAVRQYSDCKVRQLAHSERDIESNADAVELTRLSIEIVELFTDYVNYLNKINQYLSICFGSFSGILRDYDPNNAVVVNILDPTVQKNLCDPSLRSTLCEKNEQLMHSLNSCVHTIRHLGNYIQLLFSKSLLQHQFLTVFNNTMHSVNAVEKSLEEIKRLFSSKVVLEHDIGITSASELKSVDDSILSSLVFVAQCVADVRVMLEIHYCFFVEHKPHSGPCPEGDTPVDSVEPATGQPQLDSPIPDTLSTKLRICQNKLRQVEMERERCSIECQLNLVRLEREQKKCAELECRVHSLSSQLQGVHLPNGAVVAKSVAFPPNLSSSSSSGGRSVDNNNLAELGSISSTASLHSPLHSDRVSCFEEENQENGLQGPVVDSLQERVLRMANSVQMAESRAATFHSELLSLRQRVAQLQRDKAAAEQELAGQAGRLQCLRDEYGTSVDNYEQQLMAMSEHLAGLNDTIGAQRDEIDLLRYQLEQNSSGGKKAGSSVAKSLKEKFQR